MREKRNSARYIKNNSASTATPRPTAQAHHPNNLVLTQTAKKRPALFFSLQALSRRRRQTTTQPVEKLRTTRESIWRTNNTLHHLPVHCDAVTHDSNDAGGLAEIGRPTVLEKHRVGWDRGIRSNFLIVVVIGFVVRSTKYPSTNKNSARAPTTGRGVSRICGRLEPRSLTTKHFHDEWVKPDPDQLFFSATNIIFRHRRASHIIFRAWNTW